MFELIRELVKVPTVSGFECGGLEKIRQIALDITGDFFDKAELSPAGGIHFVRFAASPRAKKIIFDAHIDTVGFTVCEITQGGFLRVLPVGGIDRRILPSGEIELYGQRTLRGVFVSTPPHLLKKGGADPLPEVHEMLVDTGYSKEMLEELTPVGTPAGFPAKTTMLIGDRVLSNSLDDKICAAVILRAVRRMENPDFELHVLFSAGEETSGAGIASLARDIGADAAIVLDVNFAKTPEISDKDSLVMGKGPGISYSPTISGKLTALLAEIAVKESIPAQGIVEAKSSGTNAHSLHTAFLGTPCAVLSVPLKNMHTSGEMISLADAENTARLLSAFTRHFSRDELGGAIILKGGCHGA